MNVQNLVIVIIILSATYSFAQQKKPPLHDKKFSYEIEQEKDNGKLSPSAAAYYYTYIGNYQKALENYSIKLDWNLDTMRYSDSLSFLNYKPINAQKYLAEKIKEEQLVIISEAHNMPQHRVFTTEVLELFYENGFRHLGLETITPSYVDSTKFLLDTLLNERGYPLNSPLTGYYTREPQMGNLVREALRLGFTIFGYERIDKKVERDLQQAITIEKYIKEHPNEKVLIHCGWYHAIESAYPKRKTDNYMAYHLKKRTGIDPLTIYQDAFSERIYTPESPYYKMINTAKISVLLNESGSVFNGFEAEAKFDMLIYHPRTKYIQQRPNWLLRAKDKKLVSVDLDRIKNDLYPIIVEAIPKGEDYATPVDVIEILNKEEEKALILKEGSYRIRITNVKQEIIEYPMEVE